MAVKHLENKGEIFEINDFTNATPWETFIADIEKVIQQWGLAASEEHILDLTNSSKQHCKSERVYYAGRKFVIKLEVSGEYNGYSRKSHTYQEDEDKRRASWCPFMHEMMESQGDFPPRSHPITRWYGVRQFLLITPEKGVESLTSQAQAKLMLSSVSIAIANTTCVLPVFIQMHQQWRHMYIGIGEGTNIRTNFSSIHLKYAPPRFTHLSGLLDLFKGKIVGSPVEPIQITIRYTYVIRRWNLDEWPVEPLCDVQGDEELAHVKLLPLGGLSDPINELHLSAVWPNLSEETVLDRESHTDLRPTHAPLWTVSTHLVDNTDCFLSECLQSFLKLCFREDSMENIISNYSAEEDIRGSPHQPFSHALEKLTNASVPSIGSPFLSSVVYSASQRLEFGMRGKENSITDKKLENVLKCLFPDAYGLPEGPISTQRPDMVKSAPWGSLSWQLAITLCIVNNEDGLRAFAEVWNESVQELRYRWDQGIPINSLPNGLPDMGSCLFHQKLQMLNCCIQHKKSHEQKLNTPNIKAATTQSQFHSSDSNPNSSLNTTNSRRGSHTPSLGGSDTDEEFYEAMEVLDAAETSLENASGTNNDFSSMADSDTKLLEDRKRVGGLKQCGDLVLVASGDPLYIPITQDHTPMTEDMMWEQQSILAKLGTSEEAAKVRAKMQSSSLLSDMQAFKAANPGSLLEDFVRWYSPRDWIEGDDELPHPEGLRDASAQDKVQSREVENEQGEEEGAEEATPTTSSLLGVEEEGDGWEREGWSQEDWDVIIDDENEEKRDSPFKSDKKEALPEKFVKGRLSDRMLQPDNLWVETWQSATPLPAYRQKRIFDDTKEAEKVLHYFSNLKLSELALALMPLLLHAAIDALQRRQDQQPLARVSGLLQDALCLLATVQQPTLDSLPLYQECIGLLSQAEHLMAATQSLRNKLYQGLELVRGEDVSSMSTDVTNEITVSTEMMLESPELVIRDPMNSLVGVAMKGLLEAEISIRDLEGFHGDVSSSKPHRPVQSHYSTGVFPQATWREFILRSSTPSPSNHSQLSPQRMFCVLQSGKEFRIAGAFSTDTNLL